MSSLDDLLTKTEEWASLAHIGSGFALWGGYNALPSPGEDLSQAPNILAVGVGAFKLISGLSYHRGITLAAEDAVDGVSKEILKDSVVTIALSATLTLLGVWGYVNNRIARTQEYEHVRSKLQWQVPVGLLGACCSYSLYRKAEGIAAVIAAK